jgi:hypothetical protein
MRIYSNTLLTWPSPLYIFQASRIYNTQWFNYYFYKIDNIKPLHITTNSPIELLQHNYQYYCYDKYYRHKRLEQYDNTLELINIHNRHSLRKLWIYIPKMVEMNDIIVLHLNQQQPNTSFTNHLFSLA